MKKTVLITSFLVCYIHIIAQFNMQPQSYQSPEVASLINEIITPVSYSSGTVSVAIPLYTVIQGDITIPISLNYDASGVKVNSLPGWVGQNWNLKAGGVVTRIVKGLPDEYKETWSPLVYPLGYFFNKHYLDGADWESYTRIKTLANTFSPYPEQHVGDLEPDEFIFNFCDHQGKFYMDNNGQWVVEGQPGYKIEYAVLANYAQDWYASNDYTFREIRSLGRYIQVSTSPIGGFKITAPDGMVFYFGLFERIQQGLPAVPVNPNTQPGLGWESVEITADFFDQVYKEGINTWQLVKIVSPKGNEVKFKYERGGERVSFSETLSYNKTDRGDKNPWHWNGGGTTSSYMSQGVSHTGMVIFPSYLLQIQTDNEIISFTRSVTENLKYDYGQITSLLTTRYQFQEFLFPRNQNDWIPYSSSSGGSDYPGTNSPYLDFGNGLAYINSARFKDYKLEMITCKAISEPLPHTKFTFVYNASAHRRLQLKSLQKNEDHPYLFSYNATLLPGYLSARVDHWGYYNNVSYSPDFDNPNTLGNSYYASRNPDFNYTKAESLEKIIFPTGGSREFVYEAHECNYCVDRDPITGNLSLKSTMYNSGGGLRIKEIIDDFGDQIVKKQYTYGTGILNGQPAYYWPNYSGKTIHNDSYTAVRFYSTSIVPVSSNSAGGVVSYSKVKEIIPGKGITEYVYSNHGDFLDEKSIGIDNQATNYSPLSSREMLRGKLLQVTVYQGVFQYPVKRETYLYQIPDNDAKFLKAIYIRRMNVLNSSSSIPIDVVEGFAYRVYVHPYNVIRKTEYLKSESTDTEMETMNEWTYGPYNLVLTQSRGVTGQMEKISYYYPFHFAAYGNVYKAMVDNNMLSPVVQQVNFYNNIETVRHCMDYGLSAGLTYNRILPIISKSSYNNGANWETNETVSQYDKKGNPVEITGKDGRTTAYIWGYGGLYIVAEVQNATFNSVKNSHLNLTSLFDRPLAAGIGPQAENALRAFSGAQVKTYEYRPFVGCIRMIDPSNRATAYEYDSSGRLTAVRDADGVLLNTYEYNIGN